MKLSVTEILRAAGDQKRQEEKARVLRENDSPVLRGVIYCTLNRSVKFKLPAGTPPYRPVKNPVGMEGQLYSMWSKMDMFIEGAPRAENLSDAKREQLFIQFLEAVHPDDAKTIVDMKDHRMRYNGINGVVYKMAFDAEIPKNEDE